MKKAGGLGGFSSSAVGKLEARVRAFNFSTSREQPKEERKSRGHQRGSSSLGKHEATEGAAGKPPGTRPQGAGGAQGADEP